MEKNLYYHFIRNLNKTLSFLSHTGYNDLLMLIYWFMLKMETNV